ncbi:hypothetical protein [Streptomyces sp. NPDC007110]|uniref:hypothetical protein n=1 Tax=Streptomyces sp. NPDC007110 TaxID=3156916 RepID=UPI0033D46792
MPRIVLAHWHAGHKPGEQLDVTQEEYRQLRRDGRVASLVKEPTAATAEPAEPQPEPAESEPEPEPAESEPEDKTAAERSGRRRR